MSYIVHCIDAAFVNCVHIVNLHYIDTSLEVYIHFDVSNVIYNMFDNISLTYTNFYLCMLTFQV